ncbi:Uncharacterized conserved protein [Pricia antarctica]|uniref:Uncharacterized conserved protein n=1 Tax=Pricia antarctica TaxID=641691 RepID=A0A1G7I5P7_9FLAO|nr:App1 family protein [Pricia antarctica]SDF08041.1 Uncharacterized conserved protein [Pricia antarctica]
MKRRLTVYRGYANEQEIVVFGHVFKKNTPDSYNLEGKRLHHAHSVLRMFTIKTLGDIPISFRFEDITATTKTLANGYFRIALPYPKKIKSGWHTFTITANLNGEPVEETGEFNKPFPGGYALISDIDDTFLISHSDNFFKKIYVLLTRNVYKRKIFEGVVRHYQMLSVAGRTAENGINAFFYVSSSEWNLYNFIVHFTKLNDMPKAVLKLKDLKSGLGDFLFTGGGNHNHKFRKIKHLLEFYPELTFILLGDDSQKDPFIYEQIIKMFPTNVKAVYIRSTGRNQKTTVIEALDNIQSLKVETCYFKNSATAILHSQNIGLIS